MAGPSRSTSKSDISEVILSLLRKPRAMNGLLEARAIVPVDKTLREAAHVTMNVAMKGRIFHPNRDGWRSVPVAVIRDQLEEDPREASSSNGRR